MKNFELIQFTPSFPPERIIAEANEAFGPGRWASRVNAKGWITVYPVIPVAPPAPALLERINNDFTYHKPDFEAVDRMQQIREAARNLATLIAHQVPAGREQATALTRLEETVMHANAGITRPFPCAP